MDLVLFLSCDYANATAQNKLNIMGTFNRLTAKKFPATHPLMFVVAQFSISGAEANLTKNFEVKLLDADGKQVWSTGPARFQTPPNMGGVRGTSILMLQLTNLTLEKAGTYQFSMLVEGDEKGSFPFYVVSGGQGQSSQ